MNKYLTPKELLVKYPYFSLNHLYRILASRDTNGLKSAITAIGKKKLLINEELFDEWFRNSPQI